MSTTAKYLGKIIIIISLASCSNIEEVHAAGWIPQMMQYSLWDRIRANFELPENYKNIPAVQTQLTWYKKHPQHLYKIIENSKPYLHHIVEQVEKRGMPSEIALLPFIESNFDVFAYSNVGATGLWQMMPGTATGYGIDINWWYDGRRDVIDSTKTALNYLSYLHDFFGQKWLHAIAAYDSGEGTVRKAVLSQNKKKIADFWSLALPQETKSYTPKLFAVKEIILHPEQYGITLPEIENTEQFTVFTIPQQVDLSEAASLANISLNELRKYNPGYRRWTSQPNKIAKIVVPIINAEEFKGNIKNFTNKNNETWQKYAVKSGDTLGKIALQYHSDVDKIITANSLKGTNIKVEQTLLIPNGKITIEHTNSKTVNKNISQDHLPGPKLTVYLTNNGDTVSNIAKKHEVKIAEIEFWNKINARNKLKPGSEIIIWRKPKYNSYTVKAGDSLDKIARKLNTSVNKLKQLNSLSSDKIKINQRLSI